MSKSRNSGNKNTKLLSKDEALGVLAAALEYCQKAGYNVSVRNLAAGEMTGIGVTIPSSWFCHACLRLKDGKPKDGYACGCKESRRASEQK